MSDPITRLNAALEGRYRIERQLGEGGMATVYLADDLRHERKVAVKVLKPELAAVVGAERFLAEIKTTAGLQHPHILPLHDSGEADSFLFYVMPYIEGETLRERIDREKQLPVDEALGIATAVANALQTAHDAGVIHRDIKPGNILLSRGEPLVADFGIALAVGAAGGNRLTETGLSVGTPYYMSPEQATGDQMIGPASDTYALACVLYEMLVGDPPYIGSTAQAVLGKIIQGIPVSATAVRRAVPTNVDAAIRKALEKLPADRFTGAHDFAKALADPAFRHGEDTAAAAVAAAGPWKWVAAGMTGVAALTTAFALSSATGPGPEVRVERFASPFAPGEEPVRADAPAFELAPDGSYLMYMGPAENAGGSQLWVRRWDDLAAEPLRTDGDPGALPTLSPDGRQVAFITSAAGGIAVAAIDGGPVRELAPRPASFPRWGPDDHIYMYVNDPGQIVRVPATGGPLEPVTEPVEGEFQLRLRDFVPDSDWALIDVTLAGGVGEVRALNLGTGEMKPLSSGSWPRYAPSGHLVFLSPDGTLMAAALDPRTAEIVGPEVALLDGVGSYSISDTGKLFYSTGAASSAQEFVWVTREGVATPVDPGWTFDRGDGNYGWSLSPDGTRLAVREQTASGLDIWVKELPDGPRFRLTLDEAEEMKPRWTRDGERVLFLSERSGDFDVYARRADGTGSAELLLDAEGLVAEAFLSPTEDWLIFRGGVATAGQGTRDVHGFRMADSSIVALLDQPHDEASPNLSPDGRWLAYTSNESGPWEVFLRPFPNVEEQRVQVSTAGGFSPAWSADGRELFYVDREGNVLATTVDPVSGRVSSRQTLFPYPGARLTVAVSLVIWPHPDGERFLMARPYQGDAGEEAGFVLVNNFFEELRERVPVE